MQHIQILRSATAGVSALLVSAAVNGQQFGQQFEGARTQLLGQLESMQRELAGQKQQIEALQRAVGEQNRSIAELRQALDGDALAQQRGTGPASGNAPPDGGGRLAANAPAAPATDAAAVGRPPAKDSRPPEVAPLFEQPGVLTPKGKYVLEPSLQYGYSSSNRVALIGYTIIPALVIGLIDVREVKRNTTTAALTGRFGVNNRIELEARVPYVYRTDSTVNRPFADGSAVDKVFGASGKDLGDIELAGRYQINQGGVDKPFYVAGLRFKSRTGRDPFSVVTDCQVRCVGNASGTGLPLELPTGSGFYSIQPSLTWLFPSDPAVLFGSISYLHSFKRDDVSRRVLNGASEMLGTLEPGGVFGFNFGLGLALNDKTSLSIGYDHSSIGRMRQNGVTAPGSVRTQLGTLLIGYSYRLSATKSLNISLGAGLTRDTPDVSLSVRVPMTF